MTDINNANDLRASIESNGSTAVYVIGGPGVGKSTVMGLVKTSIGCEQYEDRRKPVGHTAYLNGWVELGRPRESFPGTDTLGHSAISFAVPWIASDDRPEFLLGEGDRLAVDRFVGALHHHYDRAVLVYLDAPPAVSYERMLARAEALGRAPQNESWWRGRCTKAANLAARWGATRVDALATPDVVAADVIAAITG